MFSRCLQYYSMIKADFSSLLLLGPFTSRDEPNSLISREVREAFSVITKLTVEK